MIKFKSVLFAAIFLTSLIHVAHAVDGNYIRSGVSDSISGWKQSSWFGSFYDSNTNWIHHESLGWLYPVDAGTDATWLYHQDWNWLWVKKEYYPWVYFNDLSSWLYFGSDSGTLSFYDYETKTWTPLMSLASKFPGVVIGKCTMSRESGILYFVKDSATSDGWRQVGEESISSASTNPLFLQGTSAFERRARLVAANYLRQLAGGSPEILTIGGQSVSSSISVEHDMDLDQMVVTGNGVPNYRPTVMGVDVTNGWNTGVDGGFESLKLSENNLGASGGNNPNQVAVAEEVFRIPLNPVNNSTATDTSLGTVGVALNGIPVYNPFEDPNETDAYGRIFSGCCGHPQLNGVYHYHKYPTCLRLISDTWKSENEKCDELDALLVAGGHSPLLGFAVDGWPIYGPVGWKDANSQTGVLLKSSYTGTDDTAGNPVYLVGSGDLDECNGFISPTPEFPEGIYHYVMTVESGEDGKVLRYINPHFGYDVRNTLNKHGLMPASWASDEAYVAALKSGFTVNAATIPGTDAYETFDAFMQGMKTILEAHGMLAVAAEFETMKIDYPFTIRKYRGTPTATDAGDLLPPAGGAGGDAQVAGVVSVSPTSGSAGNTIAVTITLDANAQPPLPPADVSPSSAQVGGIALTGIVRSNATTVTGSLTIPSGSGSGSQDVAVIFATPNGNLQVNGAGLFSFR